MATLLRLLAWPSKVLALPPRGGKAKNTKNIRDVIRRAEQFHDIPTEELLLTPETSNVRPKTRSSSGTQGLTTRTRDTIKQAIRDGAMSTAARQLLSQGVCDPEDPDVMRRLHELHPPEDIPGGDCHFQRTPKDVPMLFTRPRGDPTRLTVLQDCLNAFRAGTAAGPSGLRAQHLQDMLFPGNPNGPLLALELDTFVDNCIRGLLPQDCCTALGVANLIALKKRSPTRLDEEPL